MLSRNDKKSEKPTTTAQTWQSAAEKPTQGSVVSPKAVRAVLDSIADVKLLPVDSRSRSTTDDGYVVAAPQRPVLSGPLRAAMKSSHRGMVPIKVKLFSSYAAGSSAGSALSDVHAVTPSGSAEWTNFTALYDEVKIVGGKIHYIWVQQGTVSSAGVFGFVGYDPADATLLTGVVGGMSLSQGQLSNLNGPASVALVSPIPTAKNGLMTFRWKTPKGVALASGTPALAGAQWMATVGTSPIFGYLKVYAAGLGGSAIVSISAVCEYDCEFRSRA